MPQLPNFTAWPQQHQELTPRGLFDAYSKGWMGCHPRDPVEEEKLRALTMATCGFGNVSDAAHANGWADSAAGKLVASFLHVQSVWDDCLPGERQKAGSCVSHATAKACLTTFGCELVANLPDPLTGLLEGPPEVPAAGRKAGVVSSVAIYLFRGFAGHGWQCPIAARVVVDQGGVVIMKDYPELGLDLTHCTRELEDKHNVPENWAQEFHKHPIHSAAECNSFEEIRDALYNGYGVSSCGSEGFSDERNEDGVSRRQGSWAHAMAYIGADDRESTKSKYGGPLVLIQNSWEDWDHGPRRIMGTDKDIPVGSFWAKWSDVSRRYAVAFSNVKGWPPKKLPDYGFGDYL